MPKPPESPGEFLQVPLSADGSTSLSFLLSSHGGGWAGIHSAELGPGIQSAYVFVRLGPTFAEPGSPIIVRELWVATGQETQFNSALLRSIPFARATAAVNRPEVEKRIRPFLPAANLVTSNSVPDLLDWAFRPEEDLAFQPDLQIDDPGERRKPDEFYATVAATYLSQASISDRAARDIAEANDIQATTVHRWLKEARRRGVANPALVNTEGGPQ